MFCNREGQPVTDCWNDPACQNNSFDRLWDAPQTKEKPQKKSNNGIFQLIWVANEN